MAYEITTSKDIPAELREMLQAAYQDKPDKEALAKLKEYAAQFPAIVGMFFDLTDIVRSELVEKIAKQPAARVALKANLSAIKTRFAYDDSPVLEQMLIDNLLNCWLRLQWVEYHLASYMGEPSVNLDEIRHWERRLTESQKRHLRAAEALAKVRKLNLPALQVNINTENGQQVNIAGDLVKR